MGKLFKAIAGTVSIITVFQIALHAQNAGNFSSEPYNWKNVQMVGGGFVDGIVFHPAEEGVCYCRTDMGGAYRRNEKTMRWEPLLDWVSYEDLNLMGVESIALDPSDPDRLYLACGTYTGDWAPNGAVLKSGDRGKTFKRTNVPFKMGANENGRGNGERMAVDPNDGNILYLGTRNNGLWKSTDRSETWDRVAGFPDVAETPPDSIKDPNALRLWQWQKRGCGIIFILFDPKNGSAGRGTPTIYAGVSLMNRENLFKSTDYGKTWHPIPGEPIGYRPTHAVITSDGIMYLTYGDSPGPSRMTNGAVWKFNTNTGEWTEITPDKPDPQKRPFGYAAVSAETKNSNVLIVSSFGREKIDNGEDIFRSIDGGKTWKQVFNGGGTFDSSLAPYYSRNFIHWLFDIEIDPFDPNHAIFTTGYGGHETFNFTDLDSDKPTKWHVMSSGIEETVALDLLSPPKGAPLITAIGDYGGFVHRDLDKPVPEGSFNNPRFGNTNSVACAEKNPEIIVRTGRADRENPNQNIGYSLDGGRSWRPISSMPYPEAKLGTVAVSSDGARWIWSPDPEGGGFQSARKPTPVYLTTNRGESWVECRGIPDNTRVVADKVNPMKFYAVSLFEGKLFISTDGGVDFIQEQFDLPGGLPKHDGYRGDNRGGQDRIYTAPGREGDLWIAAFDGLYHSNESGNSFSRMNNVNQILGFGFGKGKPGSGYPALYLIGVVNNVRGIFRSDDIAGSWVRINDDAHQWGLVLQITGDPKMYGRVYVGTHGRGTFYGDPARR
jgi:hypothetical protein